MTNVVAKKAAVNESAGPKIVLIDGEERGTADD